MALQISTRVEEQKEQKRTGKEKRTLMRLALTSKNQQKETE